MLKRTVITVLVAAALTSATAGADSSSATAAAAPGPCKAAETRAVVFAFARAWTVGNVAAANRLVAPEPHFRWVGAGPPGGRSGPRAFDRYSVGAFVRARHMHHERITVTSFKFHGSDLRGEESDLRGKEGLGHFEFKAIRLSDDQPTGADPLRPGKGAIICTLARPMIAVWSIG